MTDTLNSEIETKNIIDWIIKRFIDIIELKPFKIKIDELIKHQYKRGLEKSEIEFDMNFLPDDRAVDFLNGYVYNNLKYHTDAIGHELRQELSRGIMNKENAQDLKKRVRSVFGDDKFANRLKTVLRTEAQRSFNQGVYDGAVQSGLKLKKWLDVIVDDRTSDICLAEYDKYGTKDKAIPLEDEFVVRVNGEIVRSLAPPLHVNCRTVLRVIQA